MTNNRTEADVAMYVRGLLSDEVKYRRDRRHQIFTWATTFLVATIATGRALASSSASINEKLSFCLAIVLIGGISILWLFYQSRIEKRFRREVQHYGTQLDLPCYLNEVKRFGFPMKMALLMLTVVSLFLADCHREIMTILVITGG